jgi:hypothetical protein
MVKKEETTVEFPIATTTTPAKKRKRTKKVVEDLPPLIPTPPITPAVETEAEPSSNPKKKKTKTKRVTKTKPEKTEKTESTKPKKEVILKEDEMGFYCLPCKDQRILNIKDVHVKISANKRHQGVSKCPKCEKGLYKFIKKDVAEMIEAGA